MAEKKEESAEKMIKEVRERIEAGLTQEQRKEAYKQYVAEKAEKEKQQIPVKEEQKEREPKTLRDLARLRGWIE